MKFYDKHQDKKDQFEVLAFHDSNAKTFVELDDRIKNIVKDLWKGRELPFPILLDASGKTVTDWGIPSFPTTVIINPEGKIVEDGTVDMVEKAISK